MNESRQYYEEKSVSALLLRLQQRELLIPKAMVEDVLSWNKELFTPSMASITRWKLGDYKWNEKNIPLICIEKLLQTSTAKEELQKRKIVVLKTCKKDNVSQHYSIQCKGFPKPLILSEKSLDYLDTDVNQEWIAHSISIGSRVLDIPDFEALEDAIWFGQSELHQSA